MQKLRAWWFQRQCLESTDATQNPAQVLELTGWSRSVGGSSPYVGLFARAGISRETAEKALADVEIHELPCARGCTYVVPKSEFALALKVGQGFSDEASMNTARKFLGVTDAEIDLLQEKVLQVLASGAQEPKALKELVGDASRSLGEEGKKRGQTTTLPLALGFLQSKGLIRRIPVNGRIDQQRYTYAAWNPSPLEGFALKREEAFTELASKFFTWIGPAKLSHFQWFSGLGVKASKDAIAPLGLVPVETDSDWLSLPHLLDEFHEFKIPTEPIYTLLCGIDNLFMHRRDLHNLIDESDSERTMVGEKGVIALGSTIQDLSNHAIVDRGRLVGVWEYDSEDQEIVWVSFGERNHALTKAIRKTEAFIRDQLGDCRSFSLDSPASRAPVIKKLREMI